MSEVLSLGKLLAMYALPAYVTYSLATLVYRERRSLPEILAVYRRVRPDVVLRAAVLLAATGLIAYSLSRLPGLDWGWLRLLTGSNGNALVTPVTSAGGSGASLLARAGVVGFLLVLLVAMPLITRYEEEVFRRDVLAWPRIAKRSVAFGLVHLLVGVPLCVGLALILPGLAFAERYRTAALAALPADRAATPEEEAVAEEAGLMESTVLHTAYNAAAVLAYLTMA